MSAETTHGQAAHSLSAPDIEVDAKKLFGLDIEPESSSIFSAVSLCACCGSRLSV